MASIYGRAAAALVALGLGRPPPVVSQLALEVTLELPGDGEGLHLDISPS
ncbi:MULTISPECIES: hypothetical protein [unclassified Streptomyces]|nr:hypothetical protein [Streptomyces sp. CB01635]